MKPTEPHNYEEPDELQQLGWRPQVGFEHGLAGTVAWYREWWWRPIKEEDLAFRASFKAQYDVRRP